MSSIFWLTNSALVYESVQITPYLTYGDSPWTQGACKPGERKRSSSKPLALAQFMSAFVLLGCGVCLAVVFLILEHLYFWYLRRWLGVICPQGSSVWCNLLSLSVGESLKQQQQQQQQHRQHHQQLQAPVLCVVQSPP
jgi:hypothetical protein